jgi:hypothetical protein
MPKSRPVLSPLIPGLRGAPREQSREHRVRSRPVADACGAPVLVAEDRSGRPGTARAIPLIEQVGRSSSLHCWVKSAGKGGYVIDFENGEAGGRALLAAGYRVDAS